MVKAAHSKPVKELKREKFFEDFSVSELARVQSQVVLELGDVREGCEDVLKEARKLVRLKLCPNPMLFDRLGLMENQLARVEDECAKLRELIRKAK